jgi:hypothetical protein
VFDFAALPPEINSARIISGPGSAPMVQAFLAWQGIAAELNTVAAQWGSIISGVKWMGPSSVAMRTAAAQQFSWLSQTAANAEMTATLTGQAASAYETALASMVPVPVIVANRAQLSALVSANIFGQNTAAIAQTEIQYMQMWAQDVAAMLGYQSSSAQATQLPMFSVPQIALPPNVLQFIQTLVPGFVPGQGLRNLGALLTSPIGLALISSGEFAIDPLGGATAFLALAGIGQGVRAEAVANSAMAQASSTPYVAPTATAISAPAVQVSMGAAQRVGLLRVPPSWVTPQNSTPGPVTVLDHTPQAAGPRLGAILPLPIPLVSGPKAEQERARYGHPVRMLPEKPYL